MATALISHLDALTHVTPPGHPERVARLEAIGRVLEEPSFARLSRVDAPKATDAQIERVHPSRYLERLRSQAPGPLDADTHVSPGSFQAALRAAGGNVKAVDLLMANEIDNAFVAMRPPGHHAETETPMGFCLFGNVVVGARHALEAHGLNRVAIVDFDVHHGNGTQDLIWDDDRILLVSSHEVPLYPGTGAADERGAYGQVLNVPLDPGSDGDAMRQRYEDLIFPAIENHKPDMIFVSAGFDAHAADPLANLNFVEEDFAWLGRSICDLAEKHCDGRVVSTLEGGYDLDALAGSVAAYITELMKS